MDYLQIYAKGITLRMMGIWIMVSYSVIHIKSKRPAINSMDNFNLIPRQVISNSASSLWSNPCKGLISCPLLFLFLWLIRPPTLAANILILSSSRKSSPSLVTRFGWIFSRGFLKGSSKRCSSWNWQRRCLRCWRRLSKSMRRWRRCRYLRRSVSWRKKKPKLIH